MGMAKIEIEEQLMKEALSTISTLKARVVALESALNMVAPGATKNVGGTPVQKAIASALGIDVTKPAPETKTMSPATANAILRKSIKERVEPDLKKDTGYRPNALGIRIAETNLRRTR